MKTSEYLILSIAVILITLGIANLDNLLNVTILIGTAFCIIMYVIITVVSRNRLERYYKWLGIAHKELVDECNKLELDLANQVMATDLCEKLLVNQAEKNTLEKAGQIKVKVPPITIEEYAPFAEEIKQCKQCGADMNKKNVYWVCPNCKSRKKI